MILFLLLVYYMKPSFKGLGMWHRQFEEPERPEEVNAIGHPGDDIDHGDPSCSLKNLLCKAFKLPGTTSCLWFLALKSVQRAPKGSFYEAFQRRRTVVGPQDAVVQAHGQHREDRREGHQVLDGQHRQEAALRLLSQGRYIDFRLFLHIYLYI